jgi:hypothetical protein
MQAWYKGHTDFLVRARNIHGTRWVYGYFIPFQGRDAVLELASISTIGSMFTIIPVKIETINRYCGVDCNGTLFYEGDILEEKQGSGYAKNNLYEAVLSTQGGIDGHRIVNMVLRNLKGQVYVSNRFPDCGEVEIVGNIYDNPEIKLELAEDSSDK